MVAPSDSIFIDLAVAKGHLDPDRADEAMAIERATRDDGEGRRFLRDVLVKEGWMSREQIEEVDRQIGDGAAHTGRIEGYTLLSKIAQGGMGTVYKARREATDKLVALKVLPRRMARKPDFVERFLREARAASKIESEHIVRPVDVGFSGGYYYFAMEYVEGESVDTTLSLDGPMSEAKALEIIRQMALALRDADRVGLVHRDIKPGNILVQRNGVAKLTDFGLAREPADDSTTQTGVTLGTPNYMSPEQAKAMRSLDVRSDIYSLGITLYHMVTGGVPFKGDTSLLTMLKHLNEPPVAPLARRSDLSQGCNDIILKMLAKDRNHRYRNADELITDLKLAMAGRAPKFAQHREPEPESDETLRRAEERERFAEEIRKRGRMRWVGVGSVVFVIALIGVMAYAFFYPWEGRERGASAKREQVARAALDGARRFAEEHPTRLAAIVERYAALERDCRGTKSAEEAGPLRSEVQGRLDAAVAGAMAGRRARAEALASADRFGEALAVYADFPAELKTPAVLDRVDVARCALRNRAAARWEDIRGRAESLIAANDWAGAVAALEAAGAFGMPDIAAEAEATRARALESAASAEARAERRRLERFRAAAERVRARVRKGEFEPALSELRALVEREEDEAARRMLDGYRRSVAASSGVWTAVGRGLAGLRPGFAVPLGDAAGTFVAYDAERNALTLETSDGRTVSLLPGWLPPAALKQLASAGSGGSVDAAGLAAFFVTRGDLTAAEVELRLAAEENADPEAARRCGEQLGRFDGLRNEIAAGNLLATAREQEGNALVGSPAQTAATLWELASRHAHTRTYAGHRREIEAMLARAEAESITVDTLFAVRPAGLPDGRSELTYDFTRPAHGRDWSAPWKDRSLGRWPVRSDYGEMLAESGLAYFKVPLRGPCAIAVRAQDVRTASIRLGLPEPSAPPERGLAFDWRREGEDAVSGLRGGGEAIGPEKRVRPFRAVGGVCFALEVAEDGVVVRVSDRVVHRVSGKVAGFDPNEPGYLVLAGFNPEARVTEVVIRWPLDREWLEREFVEPLRKAKLEKARRQMARSTLLVQGDETEGWRLSHPGHWTFAQGHAAAREGATCVMSTGEAAWADYTFSAKVLFGGAPGAAHVLIRWDETGEAPRGYDVALAPGDGSGGGSVALVRAAEGKRDVLGRTELTLPRSEWCPVSVELRGPEIRVRVRGEEALHVKDDACASGRVGLTSVGCGARFSDIRIRVEK